MSSDDESDVFDTFSSSFRTWISLHLFFLGILYYFLELLEAHDFLKKAQFHSLTFILFLLCHGDTQRELVNTAWTHHVLHSFLVEWGTLFMGDLVHFGTLWLY